MSVFGSLSLLPIQTPTASAGAFVSFGRREVAVRVDVALSFVVPVL